MEHRQAAEFLAKALRQAVGDQLEQVILYGSVARGDHGPDSDVDLLIVAREFRPVYRALPSILGDLFQVGAPPASPMVITADEFQRMAARGHSFYRAIASEGVRLV